MTHTGGGSEANNRSSSSFLNFKCSVVGDTGVGKTSMLMAYCVEDWQPNRGFIPPTYVPSRPFIIPTADSHSCITLTLKDTRGGQEMDELNAYDCSGADCLLICFSVVDPESFFSVEARWLPLMAKFCPDAACILVGTKIDLRQQQRRQSVLGSELSTEEAAPSNRTSRRSSAMEVTSKMGGKLARKIHAFDYLECSSTDKASLEAVFRAAINTFTDASTADTSGGCSSPKDKTGSSGKRCRVS